MENNKKSYASWSFREFNLINIGYYAKRTFVYDLKKKKKQITLRVPYQYEHVCPVPPQRAVHE